MKRNLSSAPSSATQRSAVDNTVLHTCQLLLLNMSLLSLPDEILHNLAMLSIAAHHFDAEFRGQPRHEQFPSGPVYCVNRGVVGLSVTNTRLRRICIPVLFSVIAVHVLELNSAHVEEENLEYLRRLLERQPDIAKEIRSLTLPFVGHVKRWATKPKISVPSRIIPIIALLPRVFRIPLLNSVSEELIEVLNEHPCVESVLTGSILETENRRFSHLPPNPHRSPSFMQKIMLENLRNADWEDHAGHRELISSYLELGMNVDQLLTLAERRTDLDGRTFNHVNNLELLFSYDDQSTRETSAEWLASFLPRVRSLSSIQLAEAYKPLGLPLFSDLDPAVQRSDILRVASISQYRLDAVARTSQRLASNDWNRDWRTTQVDLSTKEFPVSGSIIKTFASNLPSLTDLSIRFAYESGDPVSITESGLLSDQLRAFNALRSLSLGNLCFPHGKWDHEEHVLDEERRTMIDNLGKALHLKISSLESAQMLMWGKDEDRGRYFPYHDVKVHVRHRLVAEGGGTEVAIMPV